MGPRAVCVVCRGVRGMLTWGSTFFRTLLNGHERVRMQLELQLARPEPRSLSGRQIGASTGLLRESLVG